MIPGMVTNSMTSFCNLSHEVRVLLCSLADHEKRDARPMFLQDVKKAGREFRMRPVVEGKGNHWLLG